MGGKNSHHESELTKRAEAHARQQLEASKIANERHKNEQELLHKKRLADLDAEQKRLEGENAHKEAMEILANKRREIESAHQAEMQTINNELKKIQGDIDVRMAEVNTKLEAIKADFNVKMETIKTEHETTKMIHETLMLLLKQDMISPPDFAYLAHTTATALRGWKEIDVAALEAIQGHRKPAASENALPTTQKPAIEDK